MNPVELLEKIDVDEGEFFNREIDLSTEDRIYISDLIRKDITEVD